MSRSLLSQALLDALLRIPSSQDPQRAVRVARRVSFRLLARARTLAVRLLNDPMVSYELCGSRLALPLSHELPLIRRRYPSYSSSLPRIASCLASKYPALCLVDVGANVGDSVALLRGAAHFPILCVEGDPRYFSILEQNARDQGDVELANVFVGESTGRVAVEYRAEGGTGHLRHHVQPGAGVETRRLEEILREHPRFLGAKMVKLDTDGFDCKILRSAGSFLRKARPALFFEYDPYFLQKASDDGFGVFAALRELGYTKALIFENTGEYLIHVDLGNVRQLEDLHEFYSGWKATRYCDICAFHEEDHDVFVKARLNELSYFRETRGRAGAGSRRDCR